MASSERQALIKGKEIMEKGEWKPRRGANNVEKEPNEGLKIILRFMLLA